MEFEWDATKDEANFRKHGIHFEEVRLIFDGRTVTWPDDRRNYGEVREISVGAVREVVIINVAHTSRNGVVRIISARVANRRERTIYHGHFG